MRWISDIAIFSGLVVTPAPSILAMTATSPMTLPTVESFPPNMGLRITANNNFGDGAFTRIMKSREILRRDFVINRSSDGSRQVVIPAGDYSFYENLLGLQLGNQRKISGRITTRFGDYYNGKRWQRGAGLNWRPTRNYDFGVNYTETK